MRIALKSAAAGFAAAIILSSPTQLRAETVYHITTNLTFWAANLKVNLTGATPGAFHTNGVLAGTRGVPVRVTSQDIIRALSSQLAFTVGRALTNYTYNTTNYQAGPDAITTHYVQFAYPIFEFAMYPAYSPHAQFLMLEPLGEARFVGPLFVIRDGTPPVDYGVNNYFKVQSDAVLNEPEDSVFTGQIDTVHDLVSGTQNSVKTFSFDVGSFGGPPPGLFFDVRGWTTERLQGITRGTNVIDGNVIKSFNASVAGTGRRSQGGFTLLRGSISTEGGRLETR